jgi:hypothetical protein
MNVMRSGHVREVIANSYQYVIVDEYQDCSIDQHRLIVSLSEICATVVFGDPLQGIFDFGNSRQIQWDQHVVQHFPELVLDIRPWRWEKSNPQLGEWLFSIRQTLRAGEPIDLLGAPINWEPLESLADGVRVCRSLMQGEGTVVAISGNSRIDALSVAKCLEGDYSLMEELEGEFVLRFADIVDSWDGAKIAKAMIDFAQESAIGSDDLFDLNDVVGIIQGVPISHGGRVHIQDVIDQFNEVISLPTQNAVLTAMRALANLPKFKIYRESAWKEVRMALQVGVSDSSASVRETVLRARREIRHRGRSPEPRIVSRTLLIKGQEYDHAVILDAGVHNAKNLYVALTRGKKSVTVLSPSPQLLPDFDS